MSLRTSAHTGVAIRVPAGAGNSVQYFGQIRSAFRIRLKCYSLLCPTAGEADCHVASLLAMTCRRLLPVRIAPGYCRKAPLPRRRVSVFSMSLHAGGLPSAHLVSFSMSLQTSAWGPCKGVPFAGREAPRERCSPGGLRAAGSMADFGATRGVAIRVPVGKLCKACCCWGKIVALFVFALSATLCYVLPQEKRIATSLRSSQ